MTITPDQARELLDGATPGPWTMHRYIPEDFIRVTGEDLKDIADNGIVEDGDAHLIAAALYLAQTIAGMKTEYAVQAKEGGLTQLYYGRDIVWTDTKLTAEQVAHEISGTVVRRLVGPVEVTE